MDLATRKESFGSEDLSWLGSAHGTEAQETITLDGSAFSADFADGVIPSGTVLGKITDSGLYGPYAAAGAGGLDAAVGFLATTTRLQRRDLGDSSTVFNDVGAALLWHGRIVVSNLPVQDGPGSLDDGARGDLASKFRFV